MSQKPKHGDSSIVMASFFCANSCVNALITSLLPRATQDGLLGFARKLVHTSIFFVIKVVTLVCVLRSPLRLIQDNCLVHTNHPAPYVRIRAHLACVNVREADACAHE